MERAPFRMLMFIGRERCRLDGSGRLKLPQRFIENFMNRCGGEIVLYALPEGGLALYPEDVYREMRRNTLGDVERLGASQLARRAMRLFGPNTSVDTITRQGRITLPESLRDHAALVPGRDLMALGVEVGVELWEPERYAAEEAKSRDYEALRMEQELAAEMNTIQKPGEIK